MTEQHGKWELRACRDPGSGFPWLWYILFEGSETKVVGPICCVFDYDTNAQALDAGRRWGETNLKGWE